MKKKYYGNSKKGGVYKITNLKNGKVYIGSAKCFQVRASQHVSSLKRGKHQNRHLQASWDKHGVDAFLFEVVEVVNGNKGERFKVEQNFIDQLIKEEKWETTFNFKKKTVQKERSCWSKSPKKTRQKLSKAAKKRWSNPLARKKLSKFHKAAWANKEERARRMKAIDQAKPKLSRALKGNKNAFGHKLSKEAKEKVVRTLVKAAHQGHKHSEETKSKISEAVKALWQNEDYKQIQTNNLKDRWNNPEYKKKMKLSAKKRASRPEERERLRDMNAKKYKVSCPEGIETIIVNLKKFCERHSLDYNAMNKVASGKLNHYKKWRVIKCP